MPRPDPPDQPDRDAHPSKPQPFHRRKDLQQAAEWSSLKSNSGNPAVDQYLDDEIASRGDAFLHSETRVEQGENGRTTLIHRLILSGDFNVMKIVAAALGLSTVLAFVALVLAFRDPGWAVAVVFLVVLVFFGGGLLALYESGTRRREATAQLAAAQPSIQFHSEPAEVLGVKLVETAAETAIVTPIFPTVPIDLEIKATTIARQPNDESHNPHTLDAGEATP